MKCPKCKHDDFYHVISLMKDKLLLRCSICKSRVAEFKLIKKYGDVDE